jgi:hypothetical protein
LSSFDEETKEDEQDLAMEDPSGEYVTGGYTSGTGSSGRENEKEEHTIFVLPEQLLSDQARIGQMLSIELSLDNHSAAGSRLTVDSDDDQVLSSTTLTVDSDDDQVISFTTDDLHQISVDGSSVEMQLNELLLNSSSTEMSRGYKSIESDSVDEKEEDEDAPFNIARRKVPLARFVTENKSPRGGYDDFGRYDHYRDGPSRYSPHPDDTNTARNVSKEIKMAARELVPLGSPDLDVVLDIHDGRFPGLSDISESLTDGTGSTSCSSRSSSRASSSASEGSLSFDDDDLSTAYSPKPQNISVSLAPVFGSPAPGARITPTTQDATSIQWNERGIDEKEKKEPKKNSNDSFMCSFAQFDEWSERIWSYVGLYSAAKDRYNKTSEGRLVQVKYY